MDKIIISNLLVRGILGIDPDERVNKQDIVINLELYTDIRRAAETEELAYSIDYSVVSNRIVKHVEESQDLLIEKLVTDVARLVLSEFEVEKVKVRIDKPRAARFGSSVGIEIVRSRADFGELIEFIA
ncbi:MAG: dihydroneopterin aldolase [Chloroflexota bacterium]